MSEMPPSASKWRPKPEIGQNRPLKGSRAAKRGRSELIFFPACSPRRDASFYVGVAYTENAAFCIKMAPKAPPELFPPSVFEARAKFWSALKHARPRHPPSIVARPFPFRTRYRTPGSVAYIARPAAFPSHFFAAKTGRKKTYLF